MKTQAMRSRLAGFVSGSDCHIILVRQECLT